MGFPVYCVSEASLGLDGRGWLSESIVISQVTALSGSGAGRGRLISHLTLAWTLA